MKKLSAMFFIVMMGLNGEGGMQHSCIFCKIVSGEMPAKIIAETNDLVVIEDIRPKAPHHYLIIPKKHIVDVRALEQEDMHLGGAMFALAQRLSKGMDDMPFRVVINNGHEVGQRVYHMHMHFLAGKRFLG
jgi:histidine triad (HIT) family protein